MTIEEKIKDYQPGDRAREIVARTPIVLLAGIAGAGYSRRIGMLIL